MNSFGLGLVLNFVDNASAGMNSATNNFNRMSATADSLTSVVNASATEMAAIAFSLGAVGDTFTSIGNSVIGVFTGITQSIINTGGQMQGFRMQLSALYKDEAESKLQEIKDYAAKSVFEVESLMSAVTIMKAVGIEAMDEVTTSSGNYTQRLMDYASDIAGMIPNMTNMYGTGVNAAMGAMKEYIAEGNAMSLKRGAGLDITGLLGEEKGKTIEERTRQIADLVEVLGIAGYTKNLEGTSTQQMAKLQDTLYNLKADISDMGVFESYVNLLSKLSGWIESLTSDTELYSSVVSVLGDTISTILSPLESMLDWLIENSNAILGWIKDNPKLTKNIILTVGAIGAFLTVGGSLLKMFSSIAFAMSGLKMFKSIPLLFGKIGLAVLPFIALASLVYTAWDKNLWGIQDKLNWFLDNVVDILSIIGDAWSDNTLSSENYDLAKSLGILPFVEDLLMLKYYWGSFVEGFKKGFEKFYDTISGVFADLGIDLPSIFKSISDFVKGLLDIGKESQWESIGEVVANIALMALGLKALFKVANLFKGIGGLFSRTPILGNNSRGGGIFGLFESLAKLKPTTVLKGMLNLAIIIGGLIIIATAVMAVTPYIAKMGDVKSLIKVIAVMSILAVVGTVLSKLVSVAGKLPVSTVAKGLANLAIAIGGLTALFTVIGLVSMIPMDTSRVFEIVVIIGAIGVLGAALSAISALIGLIPVPVVALGLANIAIIIGGLALLYMAIGALTLLGFKTQDLLEVIQVITILGVLGSVLTALAGLVGLIPFPVVLLGIANIVLVVGALTELAVAVSKALPEIGSNISKFAESIKPAFDVFASIGEIDYEGLGSFFTSFGAFMLQLAGEKIVSFFTGKTDLTKVAKQLVDFANESKGAFTTISQFPSGSIDAGLSILDLFNGLSSVQGKKLEKAGDSFKDFVKSVKSSLSDLSGMSTVGSDLMQSIADGVTLKAHLVGNAVQRALSSLNITASPTFIIKPQISGNYSNVVGLSTGGYVKETGLAVLHPNEVVVNDEITKDLRSFLNSNNSNPTPSVKGSGEVKNDYSVTFNSGSIVIQLSNTSDAELDKVAEKLMKIIARKQQLRAMAVRT